MSKNRKRKSADSVGIGDVLYVYGFPLRVTRVSHLNRHPFQLTEIYFAELKECLRVSQGQQMDFETEAGFRAEPPRAKVQG